MTVYTGKTLAITNLQIGAIKSMYGNLVGKLPVEVSVLMFGAYSKLGPKAAAGKIEVYHHADGRVESLLMEEHKFDHSQLFCALGISTQRGGN